MIVTFPDVNNCLNSLRQLQSNFLTNRWVMADCSEKSKSISYNITVLYSHELAGPKFVIFIEKSTSCCFASNELNLQKPIFII